MSQMAMRCHKEGSQQRLDLFTEDGLKDDAEVTSVVSDEPYPHYPVGITTFGACSGLSSIVSGYPQGIAFRRERSRAEQSCSL